MLLHVLANFNCSVYLTWMLHDKGNQALIFGGIAICHNCTGLHERTFQ